jgi:DNA repair photolyase
LLSFEVEMNITQKNVRSILTRTNIPGIDYCLNPYVGCAHACRYCYATFMCRYSGHAEPWGAFIDVKINAVTLLRKTLRLRREGEVIVSSVTDPYQPVEESYRLTRGCLELLASSNLRVSILTKSNLVERDLDILDRMNNVEVGLTVTTDREEMRVLFEPGASSIAGRVAALKRLHNRGIATYAFIGPILPMQPERLAEMIAPCTDTVLIDRMNYQRKVEELFKKRGMAFALKDAYFEEIESRLTRHLSRLGTRSQVV